MSGDMHFESECLDSHDSYDCGFDDELSYEKDHRSIIEKMEFELIRLKEKYSNLLLHAEALAHYCDENVDDLYMERPATDAKFAILKLIKEET